MLQQYRTAEIISGDENSYRENEITHTYSHMNGSDV